MSRPTEHTESGVMASTPAPPPDERPKSAAVSLDESMDGFLDVIARDDDSDAWLQEHKDEPLEIHPAGTADRLAAYEESHDQLGKRLADQMEADNAPRAETEGGES